MDPSLGPVLYCLCIIAGCALYFHYNCEDRKAKVEVVPMSYAERRRDDTPEGEETETEERPTKKQRLSEWASSMLGMSKKAQ